MILVMTPRFAAANEICFRNLSSAREGASKIQFTAKQAQYWADKYSASNAERINLEGQNLILNQQILGLNKDKDALKEVAADYKKQYLDTNAALVKSESSKPSRFTWFGIGAITTAVLGIAAAFAIHK